MPAFTRIAIATPAVCAIHEMVAVCLLRISLLHQQIWKSSAPGRLSHLLDRAKRSCLLDMAGMKRDLGK
jgi:hypothetical protein